MKPSDAFHVSTMSKTKTSHIITEDVEFDSVEWIDKADLAWKGRDLIRSKE